ncbi:hypothetical protein C7476_109210 [Phyllobacterium bourgognense]|uniref:Uncharacterized protein n=1 Tax=Phyllobacterium bourgognense TaxID=314236 RepID=A0A368YR19_9HYPH|nr:hypothetical protein C7476_109210 [Phyllobacterium bourgognense]
MLQFLTPCKAQISLMVKLHHSEIAELRTTHNAYAISEMRLSWGKGGDTTAVSNIPMSTQPC